MVTEVSEKDTVSIFRIELLNYCVENFTIIFVDRDRDRWRALLNAVMNLRDPYNAGNFLTS
jgi:hypothetical protein